MSKLLDKLQKSLSLVETCEVYRARNGTLYETIALAEEANRKVVFAEFFSQHPFEQEFDRGEYPVDCSELYDWLIASKAELAVILNLTEKTENE